MFDFKLTETGDIDIGYDEKIDATLRVSFLYADGPIQRVKFITLPARPPVRPEGGQRITFMLGKRLDNSIRAATIQDEQERMQSLMIALRTESGDTYDGNLGTELYHLRHQMIPTDAALRRLREKIARIVQGVLPGATVDLVTGDYPDAGFFRYHTIVIRIRNGDTILGEYAL